MNVENLGLGAMIHMLSDRSATHEAIRGAIGKKIALVALIENELHLTLDDGSKIKIWDDGQSCCEHRYMSTDDNLAYLAGATLVNVEVREAPTIQGGYGDEHEVQFLALMTDKGDAVFANHNEHNGYYGGFGIEAAVIE